MAAKDESAPVPDAPKKGKKLLLIVVTLFVTLALVTAALAVWLLAANRDDAEGEDGEDVEEVADGHAGAPPIFVALDSFTVNLAHTPEDGDRYVQLSISLEVKSPDADAAIKAQMPRIRNNIILIISGKTAAELMTREDKMALAKEIKDGINHTISPAAKGKKPSGPVVDALFTVFIIQ
ncbi:MAG: flagellar basal body-associated FliL family protein [Zoogloeaceae bacterium]|jgi:flagellar FliL protein|nr:flagellar basal body-associated FliL family protein [Zoogloeaceae bacterium]